MTLIEKMLKGIAYTKGACRSVEVQESPEGYTVSGKAYRAASRALQLTPGLRVFPIIPAFKSFVEWSEWVQQQGSTGLPGVLGTALGAPIWLAADGHAARSLHLSEWTSAVRAMEATRSAVQIPVLLGVVRNKEAAKVKKAAVPPPKTKALPAKRVAKKGARKAKADSDDDSDYSESSEASESLPSDGDYDSAQDSDSSKGSAEESEESEGESDAESAAASEESEEDEDAYYGKFVGRAPLVVPSFD